MIDEVIERSREIPPYVTRAQTGPLVFPYGNTYFIHGYASDALYDAHFDLYGADSSDGYVYLFRIDPKAKHFSPYMFFKDIHTGLRKYDEQHWWEEEWASKKNLHYYLWNNMGLEIDEYDKSFVTTRGVPEMEIKSLDDLSEEGLKILELYADYANLPIEVAAQKIEHFLELRHSGLGYLPNVNENAFYSALVDLGYGGLYEWEYPEMPDLPLNFLILDPSIIESYKVVRAKDVPPNVDMGDYLHEQPWVPASFPSPLGRRNPVENTYTLYRGAPFSGLELDDLRGSGGNYQEMLGSGLYTTDDIYVASNYANSRLSDANPCVYELELSIPEDQILYVTAEYSENSQMSMCGLYDCSSSIETTAFGLSAPAFELRLKDRNTGVWFTYLISTNEDPLEYSDLRQKLTHELLDSYGVFASEVDVSEEYNLEDYLDELAFVVDEVDPDDYEELHVLRENLLRLLEEKLTLWNDWNTPLPALLEELQSELDAKLRRESGLPHYGLYDEQENTFYGGDSADLANIARRHGYKVLWCSGWISSGDEVLIVDDSIYNNGLTIVDDCT